jgi:hypothetical protein
MMFAVEFSLSWLGIQKSLLSLCCETKHRASGLNVATRLHSPTRLFQNAKHAEMQNAEQETLNDQRSAKSLVVL